MHIKFSKTVEISTSAEGSNNQKTRQKIFSSIAIQVFNTTQYFG